MILDKLAESSRRRVEERKRTRSLEALRREAEARNAQTGFPLRRRLDGRVFLLSAR